MGLYFFLLNYWLLWFDLFKLFLAYVIKQEHQQLQPIGFSFSRVQCSALSKSQFHALSASSLQSFSIWTLLFSTPWSTHACITNRWVFLWLFSTEMIRHVKRMQVLLSFTPTKIPAFYWELPACAKSPMVASKNSHTFRRDKTSRGRSWPRGHLLVLFEIFRTQTLREGNVRHLARRGWLWDESKKTHLSKNFYWANSNMEVLRQFFLLLNTSIL